MRLFPLLGLISAVFPALLHAQTVSSFTLENGLQAVVIEDNRAPVVTHMLWYRVGAADEPPGKSGIAHFFEHLMFKPTATRPDQDFSAVVESNGGDDNAFTAQDYTGYYQRVAADRLGLMMEMEADRMRNLVLSADNLATERAVVLEERALRTESEPGALMGEARSAALFMNHPYGIPVIGWRQEIEALNVDDLRAFYSRYYAPNNAVLVVAGDVTPAEVEALARQYYGPLAPSTDIPPRIRPQEPPQLAARSLVFEDARVANPYLVRIYLAPNRTSDTQKQAAALSLLSDLLGGAGIASELGRSLQLDQEIALSTGAWYAGTSLDPNEFGLFVMPRPGTSLEEAEAAMDAVLARFMAEGVDETQLARVKATRLADEIYGMDDQLNLAQTYGAALATGLTLADVAAWPEVLKSVTAADILDAAALVLNKNASVTAYLTAPATPQTTEATE
ncbi:insulinase family protein [Abyssibius alkaniclasticus]|nr:pitrilysin family protein [Abyssibius alkaniclasticus]UPH71865.1 insulinase family protein [Abyssibius alkaniclasticus]